MKLLIKLNSCNLMDTSQALTVLYIIGIEEGPEGYFMLWCSVKHFNFVSPVQGLEKEAM